MSEFSDSYHLVTADPGEVVRLVEAAGRFGMLMPSTGRSIPFLVEGEDDAGGPLDAVVENNRGILIHYCFAEDHGCWVTFFDGPARLAWLSYMPRDPRLIENLAEATDILRGRGAIDDAVATRLRELARDMAMEVGPDVAMALGLGDVSWLSSKDLTYQSMEDLQERFPGAQFVNVERRGQIEAPPRPEPNEWCPQPDQPAYMYLPVPDVSRTPAQDELVRRHYRFWTAFDEWDDERQLFMLDRYGQVLPDGYDHLPNRVMGLSMHGSAKEREILETLRAIIGLAGPGVDWEPYLRGS